MDGVSANNGAGGSNLPGSFPGASLPAMTAIGTTENFASPESTQSVELRTSNFAPEFGDRPGAESFVTTRSGTTEFHGAFFAQWRDNSWNARDWFANSRNLAYPRPYHGNVSGAFGGPVWRDKTFFFASAEHSKVSDRGLQLTTVPSLAVRANASPDLAFFLNQFSLPTGPDFGNGQAEGLVPLGRIGELANYNLRVDQSLGSYGNLFARLTYSPSSSVSEYISASEGDFTWASATAGFTAGTPGGTIHDFRLNFSFSAFSSRYAGNPWGNQAFSLGGLAFPGNDVLPQTPEYQYAVSIAALSIPGLGQFSSGGLGRSRQDQWELRETVARRVGRHQLRAGIDYIRLTLARDAIIRSAVAFAPDLQSVLVGRPLPVTYSEVPNKAGRSHMVSTFVQDTVRVSDALNLVYGLRWELTPPTGGSLQVPTASGIWSGTEWQTVHTGDINGAAPWPMRYGQVAPRVGFAYRLASDFVLRAGAGVFLDTRLGPAVSPTNGAPFNSWQLSSGSTGVGTSAGSPGSAGIPLLDETAADVRRFLDGPLPALRLPTSYQWRMSVEKGGASIGYAGAKGSHLLGNQAYIEAGSGILRRRIALTQGSSDYHALQLRYSRSLTRNLYASTSYTRSHSIDNGSLDSSVFLIHPGYDLNDARASSSFDLRHSWTSTLSYRLRGWTLSGVFRARTGFPINVTNTEQGLGRGFDNVGRPDLVAGVPVWIDDPGAPGKRRLNPSAFRDPSPGKKGTLGRNSIYGNRLVQLDVSVRREFALVRATSLQVGVNLFNVLNHPAFADPVPYRSSPLFGQSTSMQNLMLGLGTPNGGLPALFQTGGSRSAEFTFRFSF